MRDHFPFSPPPGLKWEVGLKIAVLSSSEILKKISSLKISNTIYY